MEYLHISDEDIIIRSTENLKSLLRENTQIAAFNFLIEKAKGHSKVRQNLYKNLNGSKYFEISKFTPDLAKLVFKFRTRMYDVRNNFRNKYIEQSLDCKLCDNELCQQSHIFQCSVIMNVVGHIVEHYEDLFTDNIDKLYRVAKITNLLVQTREILLDP